MASREWKLKEQRSASLGLELEGFVEGEGLAKTSTRDSSRTLLPTFVLTPPTTPTKKKRSWFSSSLDRKHVAGGINIAEAARLGDQRQDHEISVFISLTQFRLGTPQLPCTLQALGIIPQRFPITSRSLATLRPLLSKTGSPVIIRGITPSSPAALNGQLEPGDQILRVNGILVDLKGVDPLLQTLSHEIILDVLKYSKPTPPDHTFSPPPNLSSSTWSPSPPPSDLPPLLLLLTLDTREEDPPNKDILYQYPPDSDRDPLLSQVLHLRGVVATLCDISSTHFEANESCCSLVVGGVTFTAVGNKFERDLLILVLPSKRGTANQITVLYNTLVTSLVSLFGSVKRGLLSDGINPAHTLSSLLDTLLPPENTIPSTISPDHTPPLESFSFLPPTFPVKLQLSSKNAASVSTHLNQLDSGVYRTGSSSASPNPIPLGSCIFYKGYLLVSHILTPMLTAVTAVCIVNKLLDQTARGAIAQTVVWRQIHLPQTTPTKKHGTFVMIMAMEHTLLCHVLVGVPISQTTPPTSCSEGLRALLEEVHSSGLLSECDRLILSQIPVLTTADVLLASQVTSSSILQRGHYLKRTGASSVRSLSIASNPGSQSDSDSEVSGTSTWSHNPHKKMHRKLRAKLVGGLKKSKSSFSIGNEQLPADTSHGSSLIKQPYMLVAGIENLLLYFLTLDEGRGVVLCPCREQIGLQPVHNNLLKSFKEVTGAIHQILHKKYEEEEDEWDDEQEEGDGEEAVAAEAGDVEQSTKSKLFTRRGSPVREHGVLIECTITGDSLLTPPKLQYWVIGRLFIEQGLELYICYQENMSQITSEMLFKLVFGTVP